MVRLRLSHILSHIQLYNRVLNILQKYLRFNDESVAEKDTNPSDQ